MPFIPHTPESLLPRSDSKNPATTCKGITASGRSCRRALAASPGASPGSNRSGRNGVVAVLSEEDSRQGAAAFFCWQHKEQADTLIIDDGSGIEAKVVQLEGRTSLDTLADRLGIFEINEDGVLPKKTHGRERTRPVRKETLPKKWQNVPGPLLSIPGRVSSSEKRIHPPSGGHRRRKESALPLSLFCCVRFANPRTPSPPSIPRPGKETKANPVARSSLPSHLQPSTPTRPYSMQKRQPQSIPINRKGYPQTTSPTSPPHRPSLPHEPSSQTQALLSLIPATLSPQTTALLLTELARGISDYDDEGFIYMFWLTPSATPAPTSDTASALLSNTPSRPRPHGRRTSEVVRDYASPSTTGNPSSILLKIGRASNVQRRMNQWSRQCNHNLTLLRYYPYQSSSSPFPSPQSQLSSFSSSQTTPSAQGTKVPHAHKVERLIHLELAECRVKKNCDECGREHREWFEVEGSRAGVGRVDAVVKRWVNWGLGAGL